MFCFVFSVFSSIFRQTQTFKGANEFWTCLVSDHWIRLCQKNNPHLQGTVALIEVLKAILRTCDGSGMEIMYRARAGTTQNSNTCRTWSTSVRMGSSMFLGVQSRYSFPSTKMSRLHPPQVIAPMLLCYDMAMSMTHLSSPSLVEGSQKNGPRLIIINSRFQVTNYKKKHETVSGHQPWFRGRRLRIQVLGGWGMCLSHPNSCWLKSIKNHK